jgi:hypothetical protein
MTNGILSVVHSCTFQIIPVKWNGEINGIVRFKFQILQFANRDHCRISIVLTNRVLTFAVGTRAFENNQLTSKGSNICRSSSQKFTQNILCRK